MTALLLGAFWLCGILFLVQFVRLGHDPKPRRRWWRRLLLVLLALVVGCQYAGPGGYFDLSAAASPQWVVSVSNPLPDRQQFCRVRPWLPRSAPECTAIDVITCGRTLATDPRVVYDQTAARFFFVGIDTSGSIVLASAPGTDPFAVAGCVALAPETFGLARSAQLDFPQLAVSANKIVVTSEGVDHTTSLVLSKADYLAGSTLHTATVAHAFRGVLLGVPVNGSGGAVAWTRVGTDGLHVGLITGTPGTGDGIFTASAVLAESGLAALWGSVLVTDTALWAAQQRTDGTAEITRVTGLAPTFAPSPTAGYRLAMSGTCLSLGVTPAETVVVGAVDAAEAPFVAVIPRLGTPRGPTRASSDFGPALPGGARWDYCPTGAAFPDAAHPGEWYAGVGFLAGIADGPGWHAGTSLLFLRDGQV